MRIHLFQRKELVLSLFLFLSGLLLYFYPAISDFWNQYHQSVAIAGYRNKVTAIDETKTRELWREAEEYNRSLLKKEDRFLLSEEELAQYFHLLDVTGTGIMSYLEIPVIHVSLPIYHGIEEGTLQIAAGHIPGTSLPVGGEGTHCVLSGHTGLPSAKLFTDLRKMKKGDRFQIITLGRTLTYEVDQILTVLPSETTALAIEPGRDYCTLITCTPYGINSHRLLVRGRRVNPIT